MRVHRRPHDGHDGRGVVEVTRERRTAGDGTRRGIRLRVRGRDRGRVVPVACLRAHVVVVHVLPVEQPSARLGLEPLEERELLVLVPSVEEEDRGDENQERGAAYRARDDVALGRGRGAVGIALGERSRDCSEDLEVHNVRTCRELHFTHE